MSLFELPNLPPPGVKVKVSADRKRTIRQHDALKNGRHPLMGGPIRTTGETCGNCEHHVVRTHNRSWHKCRLNETAGPGTDIRVSWPGCTKWSQATMEETP